MAKPKPAALAPTKATLFAYQVGFGDCFLLRFEYSDDVRKHVLIDFGTTGLPEDVASNALTVIAKDISVKCGGKLDAVIATHRHADHISGFATKADKSGPGDIIRSLKPSAVLQPWTEQPDLAIDATAPSPVKHKNLASHAMGLTRMQEVAAAAVKQVLANPKSYKGLASTIQFIGEDNLSNKSAVKNLAQMGRNVYTYHGGPTGLEKILPGVKVTVLGPPTLKQSDSIRKQSARNQAEYWQLRLRSLESGDRLAQAPKTLFPGHPTRPGSKLPREARWLADRLKAASGEQTLQLVRSLDKQMNNTSLILLFEAGSKKLLFPGDAQFENWSYALSRPDIDTLLQDVDLYKVGHHGSLNATPKTMWAKLSKKASVAKNKKDRLKSVLSTMKGKHGSEATNTEVPRRTLLKALELETELHSTHTLPPGQICGEPIELALT